MNFLYNRSMELKVTSGAKRLITLAYRLPLMYLNLAKNLPLAIMEIFGLKVHLRYLLVPMFHDVTWVGRGLSLFFRLAILFSGSLLWLLVTVATWFLIPALIVMPVLGVVHNPNWLVIWLVVLLLIVAWRLSSKQPNGKLKSSYKPDDVLLALPRNLSALVAGYPGNPGNWWSDRQVQLWMSRMEINLAEWGNNVGFLNETSQNEKLTREIYNLSQQLGTDYPEIGEVMWALTNVDQAIREALDQRNVEQENVEELAKWLRREIGWFRHYALWDDRYEIKELAGFNRAMTGTATPILDAYSFDLTINAHKLPEAVDREDAYESVLKVLSKKGNNHVMIIGETGCGKSTFVGGLAQLIMMGNAPEQIADKRLVKLEPGRLLAGTRTQGELANRLLGAVEDIKKSENIILFIDEIHTLLTADETSGGLNMYSVLEEALFSKEIQVIGATSIENYKRYIEPNDAFTRLFEVVKLDEPDDQQALIILENVSSGLEALHGVTISMPALKAAIELSKRYIHDRVLPDKARSLLDAACIDAKGNDLIVHSEDVAKVVTRWTGVPVTTLGEEEKTKLINLEQELHQRYVDQEVAVKAVADALRRARLDIREQNRPIGTFMFVGPTGVGKTELARRLSEIYFGSESAMIRLDMGEFGSLEMIRRLIGAAPGEPGYGEGGELTEKVRRQPSALLLLDEIEKAHPKVWDLLLQVIDEGRLADAAGLQVDFTNTIIITTSNAVTGYISEQLKAGKELESIKDRVFDELLKTFKIEFLNRFDGIIPFGPLSEQDMEQVVRIQLERLTERLEEKKVQIKYTPELIHQLAVQGTDPRLGARPLRRLIQDKLESQLAKILLNREKEKEISVTLDEKILA